MGVMVFAINAVFMWMNCTYKKSASRAGKKAKRPAFPCKCAMLEEKHSDWQGRWCLERWSEPVVLVIESRNMACIDHHF